MASAQIMVVEDETIIAKDIRNCLRSFGYAVPAVASSGEEAIRKAEEVHPDLALMDIFLKGGIDGVEAGRQIRDRFNIPIVYLTAYGDNNTLLRAKKTEPFGYILKPFQERELRTTVEMALHKSQIDKKLRESQAWLSTTLNSIGDGVIATDEAGRVIFMNPVARSLIRWNQGEAVGKDVKEAFHIINEDTREIVENPVIKIIRDGTVGALANHTVLVARDGTEIPVENSSAAIRDANGQVIGAVLVFHDITKRRRAEERDRRQQERIRARDGINLAITSTLDLRVVLNLLLDKIPLFLPYRAVATVTLVDKETGVPEPIAWQELDEEEWESERGLAQVVVQTRSALVVRNVQTDPRTMDSEFFRTNKLVSYLGVPLIAKGEVLGALGFYTKEAQQFTNQEVEFLTALGDKAAIAIHNSQLFEQTKKQALELEGLNRVKSEFIGVISHELRTPLSVIISYATMIKDKVFPEPDKALGRIVDNSKQLLNIFDSILNVTKIESGVIAVASQEVRLNEFVNELRWAYDFPLGKEVGLVWNFPAELPTVKTDKDKLRHIVQNLINNAIKFTDRGSVTVSARYLPERKRVEFKVADTGSGIPKDKIPLIFDMFRQVHSSENRIHGGVGLGLHIVKKFTEMLGGKIEVESEPEKGSTFTVTVPCQN